MTKQTREQRIKQQEALMYENSLVTNHLFYALEHLKLADSESRVFVPELNDLAATVTAVIARLSVENTEIMQELNKLYKERQSNASRNY